MPTNLFHRAIAARQRPLRRQSNLIQKCLCRRVSRSWLLLLLLLTSPAIVQAQFNFTTNNGALTVTGYTGPGGAVIIPDSTNGLPVTSIGVEGLRNCTNLINVTIPNSVTNVGDGAFLSCTNLTNVTIGTSVASIGGHAFAGCGLAGVTIPNSVTIMWPYAFAACTNLTAVYFQGNAPSVGPFVFSGDNSATAYYLPGTTGWTSFLDGRPTVLWNPQVQSNGPGFGVGTNGFGFIISGTSNLVVVVEASTNLSNSIWSPLQTNTLIGGSYYFSDPAWTNYSSRFYRLRWP
ncbi:MAG TPA: leucine-rich repeat domain-containing protein [Candidatus Binatia bacterium]|jgi:hypothetical protein|nr:leucine-rich repeat domain-containing protein [Candidatus Binatia bacterium]